MAICIFCSCVNDKSDRIRESQPRRETMSINLDTVTEVEKSVYIIVFTLGELLIPDSI